MIISCESCKTKFKLDESLLKKNGSKVRCSVCKEIFTALPPEEETLDAGPAIAPPVETALPDDGIFEDSFDTSQIDMDDTDFETGLEFDEEFGFDDDLEFEEDLELELEEDSLETDLEFEDDLELEMDDDIGMDSDLELELDTDDIDELEFEEVAEPDDTLDIQPANDMDAADPDGDQSEKTMNLSNIDITFEPDDSDGDGGDPEADEQDEKLQLDFEEDFIDGNSPDAEADTIEDGIKTDPYFSEFDKLLDQEDEMMESGTLPGEAEKDEPENPPEHPPEDTTGEKALSDENKEEDTSDAAQETQADEEDLKAHEKMEDKADEALIEARPTTFDEDVKEPAKTSRTLVGLLVLIILLLAGYSYCIIKAIEIPYVSTLKIPFLTDYLETFKPQPVEIKLTPDKKSVNGRFVTNQTEGTLFVISGKVTNSTMVRCSHIQVKGTLITKGKVKARDTVIFCGNLIPEDQLKTLDIASIIKILSVKNGRNNSNMNIGKDQSVPFMVVFSNLPDNLENFTVNVETFTRDDQTK